MRPNLIVDGSYTPRHCPPEALVTRLRKVWAASSVQATVR